MNTPSTAVLLLMLTVTLTGCSQQVARLTSVDTWNIDPPSIDTVEVQPHTATWAIDDQRRVRLSLAWSQEDLILGPLGSRSLDIAVRADQPFGGVAANLPLSAASTIAVLRVGDLQHRFISRRGILGIKRRGDSLSGSLRVIAWHQRYDPLLGAWSRPAPFLITSRFDARLDSGKTDDIAADAFAAFQTAGSDPKPWATTQNAVPADPVSNATDSSTTQPANTPTK